MRELDRLSYNGREDNNEEDIRAGKVVAVFEEEPTNTVSAPLFWARQADLPFAKWGWHF